MQAPLIGGISGTGCCGSASQLAIFCDPASQDGITTGVSAAVPFLNKVFVNANTNEISIDGILNAHTLRIGGSLSVQGSSVSEFELAANTRLNTLEGLPPRVAGLEANAIAAFTSLNQITSRVAAVEDTVGTSKVGSIIVTLANQCLYLRTWNVASQS